VHYLQRGVNVKEFAQSIIEKGNIRVRTELLLIKISEESRVSVTNTDIRD
jgi:FKBP-type peptidyl-prolyl cis-trans isomerase (trigger factor)